MINISTLVMKPGISPARQIKDWISSIYFGTSVEGTTMYSRASAKAKGFATPLDMLFDDLKYTPDFLKPQQAMKCICQMYMEYDKLDAAYDVQYVGNDLYCVVFALRNI